MSLPLVAGGDCGRTAWLDLIRSTVAWNRDIPADRKDDVTQDAWITIDGMLRSGDAPRDSGAALVRLVVRHRWLDVVRRERLGVRATAEREPAGSPGTLDRLAVEQVLRRMRPEDAELLRRVEMEGVSISALVEQAMAADQTAEATQTRARIDKRVQRARLAFRALWGG